MTNNTMSYQGDEWCIGGQTQENNIIDWNSVNGNQIITFSQGYFLLFQGYFWFYSDFISNAFDGESHKIKYFLKSVPHL